MNSPDIIDEVQNKATAMGVELTGFAAVNNETLTIVICGAPLLLPILDTCPSIWGLEHDKTVGLLLQKAVNRIAVLLKTNGYSADVTNIDEQSLAKAAQQCGLGSVGQNGRLITKEYGPRIMLSGIRTDLPVTERPPVVNDLCLHCGYCQRLCPSGALDKDPGSIKRFDLCHQYNEELARDFKNPCNACLKVCPVGEDRILYSSLDTSKYFNEHEYLDNQKDSLEHKAWAHVRSYGSYPHKEE